MIISASRRTDIPAFYSEWFMRRLHEGYVLVKNPFNTKQISRVSLRPEDVECFVFWTKNAAPMLRYIDELRELPCYFQFTITPYGREVEPQLPPKAEVMRTFQRLSEELGAGRVIWRYDPILLTAQHTVEWHMEQFTAMLEQLAPYTDCCVFSFLDMYQKTERNTRALGLEEISREQMEQLAAHMAAACRARGITLQSCSEAIDLSALGIGHGACIDKQRIERVTGYPIKVKKDATQRGTCGCMKSVDIGAYNTCRHLCRYCYANFNDKLVQAQSEGHDDASPLLTGTIPPGARVSERRVEHLRDDAAAISELSLF